MLRSTNAPYKQALAKCRGHSFLSLLVTPLIIVGTEATEGSVTAQGSQASAISALPCLLLSPCLRGGS